MQPKEPMITNHKSVTNNYVILNGADMLLTSAGFNNNQLKNALDLIKNA